MLVTTLNEMSANGLKRLGIVINDTQLDKKHYGNKYGYTDEKKRHRRFISNILRTISPKINLSAKKKVESDKI